MKKNSIIIAILILAGSAGFVAFAGSKGWFHGAAGKEVPDPKEELKKIYAHYMSDTTGYDISGKILIYDEENKHELKETTTFRNIKTGTGYYSQLSQIQTFAVDSFLLSLDTLDKTITLSGITPEQSMIMNSPVLPFENYINSKDSVGLHLSVQEKENSRILFLQNDFTPEVKSMVIYYDKNTYAVQKAEVQWWKVFLGEREGDQKKYWLSDIRLDKAKLPSLNIQDEMNKIIIKRGNEISPAAKYHDYQLMAVSPPGEE